MELVIFGAQGLALGAFIAIRKLYPQRTPRCFLVSQLEGNPTTLKGTPVRDVASFSRELSQEERDGMEVLIAAPENVMDEIEQALEKYGFCRHARLTSLRWAELMSYYYAQDDRYTPLAALPVGCRGAKLHMFMARFYKDRALTGPIQLPEWVTPVQVGAALCQDRIAELLDSEGINISLKNGNYSELTALYWIWKNQLGKASGSGDEYFGLTHYRRILHLTADDLLRLTDNDIDVVLPYPMPYEPDMEEHHKRYLADTDWAALLTALEEAHPEYAEEFPAVLKHQYLYNYNIILARESVLSEYCRWLFPVLERVERLSVPRGSERNDRYIGYMAETLETLYFTRNRDRLNIAHTGFQFLT